MSENITETTTWLFEVIHNHRNYQFLLLFVIILQTRNFFNEMWKVFEFKAFVTTCTKFTYIQEDLCNKINALRIHAPITCNITFYLDDFFFRINYVTQSFSLLVFRLQPCSAYSNRHCFEYFVMLLWRYLQKYFFNMLLHQQRATKNRQFIWFYYKKRDSFIFCCIFVNWRQSCWKKIRILLET